MTKIYTVKSETSFEQIASKFKVDLNDLKAVNTSRKGVDTNTPGYLIMLTYAEKGFRVSQGDTVRIPNKRFQTQPSKPAVFKDKRNANGAKVTQLEFRTSLLYTPNFPRLGDSFSGQADILTNSKSGISHVSRRFETFGAKWVGAYIPECVALTESEVKAKQSFVMEDTPEMKTRRSEREAAAADAEKQMAILTNPSNPVAAISQGIGTAAIAAHEVGISPTKRVETASIAIKTTYGFAEGALNSMKEQKDSAKLDLSDLFIDGASGAFDKTSKWNPIGKFLVMEGKETAKSVINNVQGDEAKSAHELTTAMVKNATKEVLGDKLDNSKLGKAVKKKLGDSLTATPIYNPVFRSPTGQVAGVRLPVMQVTMTTGFLDPNKAQDVVSEVVNKTASDYYDQAMDAVGKCFDKDYILTCNQGK